MKTSYFAQLRKIPAELAVSIARWKPGWFHGREYLALAPPSQLLDAWKKRLVTEEQYAEVYRKEVLSKLNAADVVADLPEGAYLLCYEKPEDFCHRHLVAEWLRENGYECEEERFATRSKLS